MSLQAAPALISGRQGSVWCAGQWFRTVIAFLISFFLIAILTIREINNYDEGLILTGAMRVAAGAVPHRDFYTLYGPGQFYVLAALFHAFGPSVLVERVYDTAVKAAIVGAVYAISLRLMRGVFAILVAAVCALWLGTLGFTTYPIWPSLFFTLLSILPLFAILDGNYSAFRLVLSGLCAGAVFLFRYDMGMLAMVAISFALVLWGLVESRGRPASVLRRTAALLVPFLCGSTLIVLPLLAVYIRNRILNDLVFQVYSFPAAHYYETRALPWPVIWRKGEIWNSSVYLPPLTILGYIAVVISQYFSGYIYKNEKAIKWIAFLLSIFVFGFYFKGVVRVSPIHMAPSIIPSFMVLGFAADRFFVERHLVARPVLAALLLAPLALATLATLSAIRQSQPVARDNLAEAAQLARLSKARTEASFPRGGPCDPSAELDRARCFIISDAEKEAIRFVRSNSAPGDTIFVADGVNDKTFVSNNAIYFLTGRQPASKWYDFNPALQTTEAIQGQIIRDLEKEKPPIIVIDTEWDNVEEPNKSAIHSGVKELDDYIRTHYQSALDVGPYRLLRRI